MPEVGVIAYVLEISVGADGWCTGCLVEDSETLTGVDVDSCADWERKSVGSCYVTVQGEERRTI